jgi:hypothetical protein
MHVVLEFKPQDCWIGVFWKSTVEGRPHFSPEEAWWVRCDVWVCVVPMLPIHLTWRTRKTMAATSGL